MNDNVFNYALVFRAETKAARADVTDMQRAVGAATDQTGKSTAAVKNHTNAVERDSAATRRAAEEARKLADAEKRARDAALRTAGAPRPANKPGSGGKAEQFGPQIPEQIKNLRAQYVPLYAAQRTYQRELAKIDQAHKRGAISANEQVEAQRRLRSAYNVQVAAIGGSNRGLITHRKNMKLNRFEAQNLSYQINDVVQSIALGMPLQQVLMQQGPQITQIYGGVGATFKRLAGALTVGRLAIGGVTAAAVVGASAWNGYLKSTKEVATAANGIGRGVAGTSAAMEASARAGAATAGISIKAARGLETQFLRTGKIGNENFEGLIGISKDFAATIGVSAKDVGGTLSEMFADPAQAADTLLNKYGLIDAATARNVRTLAAQNRAGEARALLIDALPERLAKATEATTGLARAWEAVKNNTSNALDVTGQFLNAVIEGGPKIDLDARIKRQFRAVRRARQKAEIENSGGFLGRAKFIIGHAGEVGAAELELDRLQEKRRRDAATNIARAELTTRERLGVGALNIANASPAVSGALKRETLANEIKGLRVDKNTPGLDDTQRERINQAIEAKTNALNGLISAQSRINELGRLEVRIQNESNPLIRAEMEAQRTRLQLADQETTTEKVNAAARRARQRVIAEEIGSARRQALDMRSEAETRARLNTLVATGALTTEQANAQLQEELRLRPLVTAAAQAQGKEQAEMQAAIEELRDSYAQMEEQRVRASANDFQRSQRETLEKLRLEVSLLGASAQERAKVLALYEAEQKIRQLGLDRGSLQASQIRSAAAQGAELARELERVTSAWEKVSGAGESAIDNIVGKLTNGDISGALEGLAREITGMLTELGVANPLKNAILGTDRATLNDVGGLGGKFSRFTGQTEVKASIPPGPAASTGSMTVTANTVTVNGAMGFAQGSGSGGGAANVNGIAGKGGLSGGGGVQKQVWDFFANKGLKPHQISGIMGNVSAESGFNPLAVGDGGNAFGLFQHNDRRNKLFNSIGGKGNLGDVQAQLEFVWKELQTTEAPSMKRLRNSTNVREATSAFVGFERPRGYSVANPEGAMHFDRRLGAAQAAMTKFSTATTDATQNLGNLGDGFGLIGTVLSKLGQGAGSGASATGGGPLGILISGVAGAVGLKGFKSGSYTGGSDPSKIAGVVHQQEFVFDADATRRIGVPSLEALRKGSMKGFRSGGFVSAASLPPLAQPANQPSQPGAVVQINNYTGQPVSQEETVGPDGGRQTIITLGEQAAAAIAQPGNPIGQQMQRTYGLKRKGPSR